MDLNREQSIINQGPVKEQINIAENSGQIFITLNGQQVSLPRWEDLLERSRSSLSRLQGTPERPGSYTSQLYVHRMDAEGSFNDFCGSDSPALVMVGDAGIGKTSLLGWWMAELQTTGHIVFFYNCLGSTKPNIEDMVAASISPKFPDALPEVLEHISGLAVEKERQCVFIFDAISEFRGDDGTGPESLLKHINAFVEHLPHRNMRVILSCRTATWKRLDPGTLELFTGIYFQPTRSEHVLRIQLFTSQMVEEAYGRYLQYFNLHTPLSNLPVNLRERLRNPLMLRFLAEAYQNQAEPIAHTNVTLSIFQSFYESRFNGVKGRQDRFFINEFALEVLKRRRSILPLEDLIQNERLVSEILSENPDSSYNRLLDNGILTEVSGNLVLGDMVKFTYDQFAGYILALYLIRQAVTDANQIVELVRDIQQFSLAWYIAWMLLILRKDVNLFVSLAQSPDIELRELVVQSLVEMYPDEPAIVTDIIKQLIQIDSKEAQRTGLKIAYFVNPHARQVFISAVVKGSPTLRRAVRDTLYLIWQTDPEFVYGLLRALTALIKLPATKNLRNTANFILDLLVIIYINHCEQKYVIEQTSAIFYELMRNRLHLNWFKTDILGKTMERFLLQMAITIVAKPIIETILFAESRRFFKLSLEDRACLKRIAPFLDPQTDLEQARDELAALLKSDILFFNDAAMLALAVHAYRNFRAVKPLICSLFEQQEGRGRLWILFSFGTLLPDSPPEWIELAEEFTQRLVEEHPAIYYGAEPDLLMLCDFVLLPLGLTYGKRGESMPYFAELLNRGLEQGDSHLVERCIVHLGPVGFYYPKVVFKLLQPIIPHLDTPDLKAALIRTLAMIRVLHFDEVDNFLYQVNADEVLQHRVMEATNVDLVSRFIQITGLQNNAVHFSVFYPKMRRYFSMGALEILAEALTLQDAITRYALNGFHLTQEANFQLKNWTLPD